MRNGTGGAACLHLSKSTGNVWLPLTMGGDCSRWYLRKEKEKRRKKKKEREGETNEKVVSVLFLLPSLLLECFMHMAAKTCLCLCGCSRGVVGWSGLDSILPDYSALLAPESRLWRLKMSSSLPSAIVYEHLHTQIPTPAVSPSRARATRGISVLANMRTGEGSQESQGNGGGL